MTIKKPLITGLLLSSLLALSSGQAMAAKACKELSKNQCESSTSCSFVKGYTTKTGTKVSAHCRNKPGAKKAKKDTKKTDSKASASKQKAKASDKKAVKKTTDKKKKEETSKSTTK